MTIECKFAVYECHSSRPRKQVHYRIVEVNGLYSIQKYNSDLSEWVNPFVVEKLYPSLKTVLNSSRFKHLFIPKED